ncbi:MAG: glycosyltransferase [Actinomycetota bacterium]|nr:glycosyltransferase [Actinomycetota bacterium]
MTETPSIGAAHEPLVSVVICAYTERRWNSFCAAVTSVRAQRRPPLEIVAVIDHQDNMLGRARVEFPDIVALANRYRPGLSGARNTGVEATRGDIVAFLDDDAEAAPDWLRHLARHYQDPVTLGVGGAVLPIWLEGRPQWWPDEYNWVVGCSYLGLPDRTATVRNPIGANMSFRRALFDEVGGFRLEMGRVGSRPFGCEETEFCIRARQRFPDGVFVYDPAAIVHHRVPPERATWSYFVARCYAEGQSKAFVSSRVGAGRALASERRHILRVLPRGVASALRGPPRAASVGRAGAIAGGLALATAGYLTGSTRRRSGGQ